MSDQPSPSDAGAEGETVSRGAATGGNVRAESLDDWRGALRAVVAPFTQSRSDPALDQDSASRCSRFASSLPNIGDDGPEAAALAELERTNTLLAAIVESSDDAILSKTLNGRIISWNSGAQQIFGYSSDQIVGQPVALLCPPDRIDEELHILERLRRGERIAHFETIRRTKAGLDIQVSMTVSPVLDREGRIIGASNVVRDLSRPKLTEHALHNTEARLQLATQIGSVGIWDWEIATDRVAWSDALCAIHGVDAAQFPVTVESFASLVHPDDRRRVFSAMAAALEHEAPYELEFRAVRPDGGIIWLFTNAVVVRENGRPVRMLGATLDVTQRQEAQIAIQESEERYRRTVNALPVAVYTTDAEGRVTLFNEAAVELWGWRPKLRRDVWRGSPRVLRPDGSELPLDECPMAVTLRTGKPMRGQEILIERPDGTRRNVLPCAEPCFGKSGVLTGTVNALVDITDRKQGEARLKEAKEIAEAANAAKDRFLAVLSHELRTPLTPVLITVGALERDTGLSDSVREDVAMLRRNVEIEARLIDDLLDLTRIASGRLDVRLEWVELNEVVRHVFDMGRPEAEQKRIRLECELDPAVTALRGDPARLQQVFWNVLRNSLKFTPAGGDIRVRTRRTEGGALQVEIHDTGIGLDREAVARIFSAFEQADSGINRRYGGLGLGLAISKALVERHGGSIRAESDGVGCGATFVIEFPAAELDPLQAHDQRDPPSASLPRLRVLVVEDHADTAMVLARLLRSLGHHVCVASGVSAAMECAERESFDLLLSDLGLTDGSGHELMERLGRRSGIVGIALSGYGMEGDLLSSQQAGFAEHLVKPVTLSQLAEAISRTMNGARRPRKPIHP